MLDYALLLRDRLQQSSDCMLCSTSLLPLRSPLLMYVSAVSTTGLRGIRPSLLQNLLSVLLQLAVFGCQRSCAAAQTGLKFVLHSWLLLLTHVLCAVRCLYCRTEGSAAAQTTAAAWIFWARCWTGCKLVLRSLMLMPVLSDISGS